MGKWNTLPGKKLNWMTIHCVYPGTEMAAGLPALVKTKPSTMWTLGQMISSRFFSLILNCSYVIYIYIYIAICSCSFNTVLLIKTDGPVYSGASKSKSVFIENGNILSIGSDKVAKKHMYLWKKVCVNELKLYCFGCHYILFTGIYFRVGNWCIWM